MMGTIINFLKGIANGVTAIISFVLDLIADLLYVGQLLAQTVAQIPELFSFLPAELLALVVSAISIVVIYKLIGRD